MIQDLRKEIKKLADPKRASAVARYFKTGKGEYGEGDQFVGLSVPQSRMLAKKYKDMPLIEVIKLLQSPIHKERMIALFVLISQYKKVDEQQKKNIFDLYLSHTKFINNWDLIDSSAEYIVGNYLRITYAGDISLLREFAVSESVWERRIAMLSTFEFIKNGSYKETFEIAEILLHDKHDLIQKAVGWMLREVGKKVSEEAEIEFLSVYYKEMPRTTLRYAIERLPEEKKKFYMLK